jgi:heptosyltransferase II
VSHASIRQMIPASVREPVYRWRHDHRPSRYFYIPVAALFVIARRLRAQETSQPKSIHRILVIHPAGLGDMLLFTPVLRALCDAYPGAEIDVLALHRYVGVAFADQPRIHHVFYLHPYPSGRPDLRFAMVRSIRTALLKSLKYYPRTILQIVRGRYDLGINASLSIEYDHLGNALLFAAGIPTRLGMRDHQLGLLTYEAVPDFSRVHRVQNYLKLLAPLHLSDPGPEYEYQISKHDEERAQEFLREMGASTGCGPLVAFQPGANLLVNSRRWPAAYFSEVARALVTEMSAAIVLLGDGSDRELCGEIAAGADCGAIDAAGKLTFSETAALLARSQLCITNDTSTLHLAEAMGTPRVISIFGPTAYQLIAPGNSRHISLHSHLPCVPCLGSNITKDSPRCWRVIKEECLWTIEPQRVVAIANKMLSEAGLDPR